MSSITVKDEPIVEKMVQMGRGHLMDVVHKPDLPPRVSVIIPTYNRAQMVCACVDSVLRSDWPDMEVIVADDCSPDDTRRMVEERYRSEQSGSGDEVVPLSHHPRRGSRAASSSTFPYGLYRQKEYLPLLTTIGRAGRAPEKLLLPLTSGYEWPRLILLEGYRRKV